MIDEKEMTATNTSVGADEGQSLYVSKDSISDEEAENKEKLRRLREMQRLQDPSYLHTFSMNELYDRVIVGRPPLIDGLLPSALILGYQGHNRRAAQRKVQTAGIVHVLCEGERYGRKHHSLQFQSERI